MKREHDHVGDRVDGEAREGLSERLRQLDRCTPEDVAHACIYGFAIEAFQKQGMAYDAYMLINRGFAAFRPRDDSYSICCPESFLVLLTSNAKFGSYAERMPR